MGLMAQDSETIWARFNVMIVANSIIVAAIVVLLTSRLLLPLVTTILPFVGFIICLMWYLMMHRAFDYQLYLKRSALELEQRYLRPVKTIARGRMFADGNEVTLSVDGRPTKMRMRLLSGLLRAESISYIVVVLFALLYLCVEIQVILN